MSADGVPLVSIGIPTYRGAACIGATIESVLAQSLRDFELIVVDDASPDGTADVVSRYRDPRIRLLRNSRNVGAAGNWNRCLTEARGKYFKLLPQDDLLMPDCLERQVAVLDRDAGERLALVFSARRVVTGAGREIMVRGYPGRTEGTVSAHELVLDCVRRGTTMIGEPGAVLFRRKLAQRVGEFDASADYVIDLDYFFRLLRFGDAYYFPRPLATFRVSRDAWSVAIGSRQSSHFSRLVRRISPDYGIGAIDRARGHVMAAVNNLLRLLFYRLFLR